jgi:TIR domain-containing protein
VFVSHRHLDRDFVEREVTRALAESGIVTWYSAVDIRAGEDFVRSIEEGLMKCDWMIVIVSKHSATSRWVRLEISTALSDPRFENRIIPIRVDGTAPEALSPLLLSFHHVDARQPGEAAKSVRARILDNVRAAAASAAAASQGAPRNERLGRKSSSAAARRRRR